MRQSPGKPLFPGNNLQDLTESPECFSFDANLVYIMFVVINIKHF